MRNIFIVVLALVLASGCKSKGEADKVPPKPAADPSGASAEPASAEPAAAQAKPVNELFTGPKVALPAPLAAIVLRGTTDAAKQAAPWLFAKDYGVEIEGYQDVEVNADLTSDDAFVRDLRLTLPKPLEESKTFLAAVWGEPRAVETAGGKRYEWTDAAAGLRAYIDEQGTKTRMIYEPILTVETFLGTEAGRFGFEKLPLLGAAEADVKTAHAAWLSAGGSADRISIGLPALDVSEYEGSVSLDLVDGKVVKMTIQISFSYDKAAKDAILAGLEKKFGTAVKGDMYIDYPGPPKIKVDASSDDQLVIWVGGE